MKKQFFFALISVMMVNIFVLSVFLNDGIKASEEGIECDCSWGGGVLSPCFLDEEEVLCRYENPEGYPYWVWELTANCKDGSLQESCNCNWEFNFCQPDDQ